MSYNHFTPFEHSRIEVFTNLGYSNRKIAKILIRHYSSISREIIRNSSDGVYYAENTQVNYEIKKKNSGACSKLTYELIETIDKYLKLTWSPEQNSNTVLKNKIFLKQFINSYI